MALSILDNTTVAFNCDSTSDNGGTWTALGSAASLAANGDILKVGTGSIGAKLDGGATGAQGGMQITRGTAIDFDDAGTDRGMVAVWCFHTGVIGANGIRLRLGSDASNYKEWIMSTVDGSTGTKYQGGFQRMVVDVNSTPNSTVLTPDMANIDYFAIEFDTDTDIMGNIPTIFIDQIDVLTAANIAAGTRAIEVRGTTTSAGTALSELAALTTVTDLGAIIKSGNSSYDINMPIKFGDTTTSSDITSTNEYGFIPSHNFADGFCVLEFDGGTGTNTSTWGAESGTGDNTLGATGGSFVAGSNGNFTINCSHADSTNIFAGVIIDGANSVTCTSTNTKFVSCTLVNSGSLTLDNGGEFRDSTITDSTTISGVGAVILASSPVTPEFRDNLIQNCIHGIENEVNGPITWDLRNISFSNNTADIRFNHASGLLTVNVLEGSDSPSTSDGGAGGTISVVASQPITITVKDNDDLSVIQGVQVYVEQPDGTLIVSGSTNASGVFSDTTSFSGAMVYKLRKSTLPIPRYFAIRRTGTIASGTGFSTEVLMVKDTIAAQS